MPRKRTIPQPSGYGMAQAAGQAGTQAPVAPTGMPYGEHQQTVQAQQQMPLPDLVHPAAQQAAQGMAPPDPAMGLFAPTAQLDVPLTVGLPPGMPAAPPAPKVADLLRMSAEAWGDDGLHALADEAQRRNL